MKDHLFIKNFFTENELLKVISLEKNLDFEQGKVSGKTSPYRAVESCFVHLPEVVDPTTKEAWLTKLFNEKIKKINKGFNDSIDVSGGIERDCFSFLKYKEGDHFDWHLDNVNSNRKKLIARRNMTLIIQLSAPKDYEGGEVLLRVGDEELAISKEKNFACAFLSTKVYHKVCPVKSGIRKSIVMWAGRKSID